MERYLFLGCRNDILLILFKAWGQSYQEFYLHRVLSSKCCRLGCYQWPHLLASGWSYGRRDPSKHIFYHISSEIRRSRESSILKIPESRALPSTRMIRCWSCLDQPCLEDPRGGLKDKERAFQFTYLIYTTIHKWSIVICNPKKKEWRFKNHLQIM